MIEYLNIFLSLIIKNLKLIPSIKFNLKLSYINKLINITIYSTNNYNKLNVSVEPNGSIRETSSNKLLYDNTNHSLEESIQILLSLIMKLLVNNINIKPPKDLYYEFKCVPADKSNHVSCTLSYNHTELIKNELNKDIKVTNIKLLDIVNIEWNPIKLVGGLYRVININDNYNFIKKELPQRLKVKFAEATYILDNTRTFYEAFISYPKFIYEFNKGDNVYIFQTNYNSTRKYTFEEIILDE